MRAIPQMEGDGDELAGCPCGFMVAGYRQSTVQDDAVLWSFS